MLTLAPDGSLACFALLTVADEAARLALPLPSAKGRAVKQADTGCIYALVPHGLAHVPADWDLLGLEPVVPAVSVAGPEVLLTAFDPATATLGDIADMLAQLMLHLRSRQLF